MTLPVSMFMVLCSWQSHCESSPGSFDECRLAPSSRRPSNQTNRLGLLIRLQAAIVRIHYSCLLLLPSPKVDTHFNVPWRVEG